ncbi:MAG: hypothetical protein QJR08_00600 [Bacillota bacterium]|nr:hypothetical protein [Bacillota bacterium]
MGSGSKHKLAIILPAHGHGAAPVAPTGNGGGDAPADPMALAATPEGMSILLDQLYGHAAELQMGVHNGDWSPDIHGVGEFLDEMQAPAAKLHALYHGAAAATLPDEVKHQLWHDMAHAAAEFLGGADEQALSAHALNQGFPHPTLVSAKAKAYWLNPFYPLNTKKEKIAQKAASVFAAVSPEKQSEVLAAEEQLKAALEGAAPVAEHAPAAVAEPPAAQVAPAEAAAITALPKAAPKVPFKTLIGQLAGIVAQKRAAAALPAWEGRQAWAHRAFQVEDASPALGGVHAKRIVRDEQGRRYLFKVDKHGGARALAEEAAAEVARAMGLPAVEARAVTVGGERGVVQPFIEGAQELPPDPALWTPAQRQAVMVQHVADWLVGDHDGHPPNFLVVQGVPVRIDRGQAWKHFGRDRLSLDYEPNASFGAPPHAAILLYRALKQGKVPVNPHLLKPVIEAAEAIPDGEYRAMLAPVATAGAKRPKDTAWYESVAGRAQARLGREPTKDEVSEEFLRLAVERKHRLRKDFEEFLSGVLGQPFTFGG